MPGGQLLLTQMGTEKNAKVMEALALLLPRRNWLGGELCHWLARKQKPRNQMPAQRTGGAGEKGAGGGELFQGGPLARNGPLPLASVRCAAGVELRCLHFNQLKSKSK